jgi:outer membrane receptor protein involved in Fe transport
VDGAVLIHELPVLTLLDGRRFPISNSLGRMGMTPLSFFPVALVESVDAQKVSASPRYGSDAVGGLLNLRLNRVQTGGEVGVFYGKSGGKYSSEDFETHIIGTLATDRVQITAGAAYQESSGHFSRSGR